MHVELDVSPPYAVIGTHREIPAALRVLGVPLPRPVLVCVGGAGGMDDSDIGHMTSLLRDQVVPVVDRVGAVVLDGGTDAGVMRMLGTARSESRAGFPLVGVAAAETVRLPRRNPLSPSAADVERRHTALLAVPGEQWGDESEWISLVASCLAAGRPTATMVINGGGITYHDVEHSLAAGRPVLVAAGTGRTADVIALAVAEPGRADERTAAIAASSLVSVVRLDEAGSLRAALLAALVPDWRFRS